MRGSGSPHEARQPVKMLQLASTDFMFKMLLEELVVALRQAGYDLTIACADGPYLPEFREAGYRVKTLSISPGLNVFQHLFSLVQIYRFIKREKFDIVHTHTPVAAFIGRLAARMAGTPYIANTVHGFYFHENMAAVPRKIFVALERFAGRVTDLTFCESDEDFETAVRERICPPDRIVAIGNGANLKRFDLSLIDSARRRVREELALPLGADVVGIVGRIVERKGFVEFVRSMPRVLDAKPDTRFLIVGDALPSDNDSVKDEVKRLVESFRIKDKVVFAGLRLDIAEVLSAMDLFVLPSYWEGMPGVVLEAMAMARPVVTTRVRGCREVTVDGQTGILVPPRDVGALADAVIRLLSDKELAHRMGLAGRKRVEERFDRDKVVKKQLDAFANLVAPSPPEHGDG